MAVDEIENRVVAACMGSLSIMHAELLALGDDELDPAICSIEDAWTTLVEVLTGVPSAQAFAEAL